MAESKEPKRPVPPGQPGSPLPRLWKYPDEEDSEGASSSSSKPNAPNSASGGKTRKKKDSLGDDKTKNPSRKSKGNSKEGDGKGKSVLVEETPELDTHETRQKVRIAIGAILVAIGLVIGLVILRAINPAVPPEEPTAEGLAAMPVPTNPRARDEQEARILFNRAHDLARTGKVEMAVAQLKRITSKYPTTKASVEARQALDRPKDQLPLFLERPAVVASPGDSTSPQEPDPKSREPEKVVAASPTTVVNAIGASASLSPPVNASEPVPMVVVNTPPGHPNANAVPSRPLPNGFHMRSGVTAHSSGWPTEIVGDRDGAPMVFVPGGTFLQGRDDADPAEGPEHKVILSAFYIDKHEVTVRQFLLFQKEAGRRKDRDRALAKNTAYANIDEDKERPVLMVTARDASDYASWAGKRLPTEAQWEASARTPDGRIFPWGPEPAAWSHPRDPRQIDPVMSFPSDASPYGVFDLAGNAWEWTKDWFEPRYYQSFRNAPAENPTGPPKPPRLQQLVVKGTSRDWRVSKREGYKFDTRLPYLGFRCVLSVEGPGNAFEATPPVNQPGPPGNPIVGGGGAPF